MRVCFVVSQIFAYGKYGGFGSLTRTIGRELVKRGIEVYAVVPRRGNQRPVEKIDGITVMSFSPKALFSSRKLYQACDADIYHSQEPTIGTYLAMKAMPERRHIVTAQDPRTIRDWMVEYRHFSANRKIMFPLMYLYEKNYWVKKAVRCADAVFCQAKYIIPKTKAFYNLDIEPSFLPNPVKFHEGPFIKAKEPTVCFLARWDRRKRPEIFFDLAKKFRHVKFIAIGKAHDKKYDDYLRKKYSGVLNLEMVGFIDQFTIARLQDILTKSWIMINTAARECLPVAFLEAAASKCAILSCNNPDGFADNFGYYVKNNDYACGLEFLLRKNRWREKGQKAYVYAKETHESNKVIQQHISIYEKLHRNCSRKN